MCNVRQHKDGHHPGIDGSMTACSCQAQLCINGRRTPAPAASRVPAAVLPVFALAPDAAVGAHAFAAAVAAVAPLAVMLADAGASAVLAGVPHAVVLADAGGPTVLACAPDAVMLADAGAPAVLA
jgi:hypothetical protein